MESSQFDIDSIRFALKTQHWLHEKISGTSWFLVSCQFFLWTEVLGNNLIVNNIIKRGMVFPNVCLLCMKLGYEGEECWAITAIDDSPLPVSKVPTWVLERMEEVGNVMWLSFEGVEKESLAFFTALEKHQQKGLGKQKVDKAGGNQIPREPQNLQCAISYEEGETSVDRSSERKSQGSKGGFKWRLESSRGMFGAWDREIRGGWWEMFATPIGRMWLFFKKPNKWMFSPHCSMRLTTSIIRMGIITGCREGRRNSHHLR